MTKKLLLTLGLASTAAYLPAQCLVGNCETGWGKFQTPEGVYDGEFKNGKYHGRGNFFYPDGRFVQSQWRGGQSIGEAQLFTDNGQATKVQWRDGQWQPTEAPTQIECISGDCENGFGTAKDNRGRKYRGNFVNGLYHGAGILEYPSGEKHQGMFENGFAHGFGRMVYKNNKTEEGFWDYGRMVSKQAKVWAVIVGVGKYQQVDPLEYTSSDAKYFYEFLTKPEGGKVPQNQIKLLLDEEATLSQMQNTILDVFEQADTADLIIFYFAGHGLPGGLVPVDYDTLQDNLLHHTMIHRLMMDSKAKHRLCIADACHSGSYGMAYEEFKQKGYQKPTAATRNMSSTREQVQRFYKGLRNAKSGLAIILSSSAEEISLEASKLKHGVFTYFLIQGLKGQADENKDAMVSVSELFKYLDAQVRNFTFGYQNPMIFGEYDEKMPVAVLPKQ